VAELYARIQETAGALKARGLDSPALLLIYWGPSAAGMLGGLQAFAELGELPHCPSRGRLLRAGRILVLEDAPSRHDGFEPELLAQLPRAARLLGATSLVLAGPAKVLKESLAGRPLLIVADHLNLSGDSPLVGPHDERLGERFPDMGRAWSPRLRARAGEANALDEAVLAGMAGPSLETPAQLAYLAAQGADLADWRFLMENQAAVHAGMEVLGLAWPRVIGEDEPTSESMEALRAVLTALAAGLEPGEV